MRKLAASLLIALGVLCYGLLAGIAYAQAAQPEPASRSAARQVADAIAKVKSGKFIGYDVEVIAEARALVAIPDLEKQFTLVSDPIDKAKIAQVLLLLGDKKDAYWDYLAELVKPALESDAPDPAQYDAQRKQIRGVSQEFLAWAKAHGQSPGEAAENAIYNWPGIVMLVGATRDSRALPLLRRAFSSPNPALQISAADGFAEMLDTSSVPLMIERCKNAPPDVANAIAQSLVSFDDPEAQKMVDTYVPKDVAKALRDRRMAGLRR
jgi:HEAT repeat protein